MGEHDWPGAASLRDTPESPETTDYRESWDSAVEPADPALQENMLRAPGRPLRRLRRQQPQPDRRPDEAALEFARGWLSASAGSAMRPAPNCVDGTQLHPSIYAVSVDIDGRAYLVRWCNACGRKWLVKEDPNA